MSLMIELGSAIKAKLSLKADKNNPTFTGNVVLPSNTKIGTIDSVKISYLNTLTSNVQSQINSKQDALISGTNIKSINSISILGSGDIDLTSMSITGNAASAGTATKLQTSRKINGTSFDGTSDISTSFWGTSRNVTIGNIVKVMNGSSDVSFSHSEMGTVKDLGIKTVNPVGGDNQSCTTAQFISYLNTAGAFNQALSIMRVTFNYAGCNNISDIPFGILELAGCIIETFYSSATQYIIRVTSPSTGVGAGGIHEYVYHGDAYLPGWRRVYTSALNGNTDTATKLQTARTINGVLFDGSANITIVDSTKAPKVSPVFTGSPQAPTAAPTENSTVIATTAFANTAADNAVQELVNAFGVHNVTLGLGGIGSYALLAKTTSGVGISAGTQYAGSSLAYCGFGSYDTNNYAFSMPLGVSPAGTWRALGTAGAYPLVYSSTLFIRIA